MRIFIVLCVFLFARADNADSDLTEPPPPADVTAPATKPPPIWVPNEFPRGDFYNGIKIREGDLEETRKSTGGFELSDLLRNDLKEKESGTLSATYATVAFGDPIDDDTEPIDNGENTEERRRLKEEIVVEEFKTLVAVDPMERGGWLAGTLVAFLVVGSAVAYLGLLSWRRYLEYKYGSRQVLVNEEDFEDPNDIRHFSI
ncbi:uncharacterized protein LOC132701365 [Cylas formicarius]|uniref:uncharacterized protein LOC132701365 n=1 Tax=Cylas formicarius TaxID=197179 RepID=UPI0029583FDC|nr:uncharacterized protein LOC132701365 [Cylas formicarius]